MIQNFTHSDGKMAFKLPFITKKAIVPKVTDLPQFRYEDLELNISYKVTS